MRSAGVDDKAVAVATGAEGHEGKLRASMERHFGVVPPRAEGAGALMHQVLPVIGQGLPAQGRGVTGRHQTFRDSREQLQG